MIVVSLKYYSWKYKHEKYCGTFHIQIHKLGEII